MNINGYQLIGELQNDKSGYSRWGFAMHGGVEVFIKEFLSPVYPVDARSLSEVQINRKREICNAFAHSKQVFYQELGKCMTGNIITVLDFFRFGSRFYIVTEKVDASSIDVLTVSRLAPEQKILIMKVISYCLHTLHSRSIVHGDLKPDNILLKQTQNGAFTAKIIDFDSGFLEKDAPKPGEDLQGDTVYFAPESFLFIAEENDVLDRKIDIFALGIIFHQYFCGDIPNFDRSQYDYLFEAILDGGEITLSRHVPDFFEPTLRAMLDKDPAKRPEAHEVLAALQQSPIPAQPAAPALPVQTPNVPQNQSYPHPQGYPAYGYGAPGYGAPGYVTPPVAPGASRLKSTMRTSGSPAPSPAPAPTPAPAPLPSEKPVDADATEALASPKIEPTGSPDFFLQPDDLL